MHHDVERPATAESRVNPVQSRGVDLVAMLYNGSPDPCTSEKSHDEYIRIPSALVKCEALPVEETSEEQVCCDLT